MERGCAAPMIRLHLRCEFTKYSAAVGCVEALPFTPMTHLMLGNQEFEVGFQERCVIAVLDAAYIVAASLEN